MAWSRGCTDRACWLQHITMGQGMPAAPASCTAPYATPPYPTTPCGELPAGCGCGVWDVQIAMQGGVRGGGHGQHLPAAAHSGGHSAPPHACSPCGCKPCPPCEECSLAGCSRIPLGGVNAAWGAGMGACRQHPPAAACGHRVGCMGGRSFGTLWLCAMPPTVRLQATPVTQGAPSGCGHRVLRAQWGGMAHRRVGSRNGATWVVPTGCIMWLQGTLWGRGRRVAAKW